MKKLFVIISVILIISGLCFLSCRNSNIKYPSGKDTVESFGDGTFQIGRVNQHLALSYAPIGGCLIPNVDNYYESNNSVYIRGHETQHQYEWQIFAIIDLAKNTMRIYSKPEHGTKDFHIYEKVIKDGAVTVLEDFSDFTVEEQDIFKTVWGQWGQGDGLREP